jgi:hypothetical protein
MQVEILKHYSESLPWHGFAGDRFEEIRIYAAIEAIKRAFVQANPKHSITWMIFDVDSSTASTDWIDVGAPIPNILALNRDNGHAHLFYGLETPVHKNPDSSDKALRYYAAVEWALTVRLNADRGYTGFLSKNPLHKRWSVVVPYSELYTLDQLARGLDLDTDRRKRMPDYGVGRNVNLFNAVRRWAYKQRRNEQQYLSFEMFREACQWHALAVNAEFEQPLPHSEVRATAKSIAKWTWRNMSPAGFREWARRRGKASGRVRTAKSLELRERILETVKACPELSQADIAVMLGVTQKTVSNHLIELKKQK